MYKVNHIEKCAVTSFIDLTNLDTGTQDVVFDDSLFVKAGYDTFEFIREGESYDCKIELFGVYLDEMSEPWGTCAEVTVVNQNVTIGEVAMLQVQIGQDIYYIRKSELDDSKITEKFFFRFTRKDLVQVDDVVHGQLKGG